jgi:methionyl aminopeptidase
MRRGSAGNLPVGRPILGMDGFGRVLPERFLSMSIPVKSSTEIEKMRKAGRVAATVLGKISALVEPGVTTGEIDRAAARFMAELGGRSAFLDYPYRKRKSQNFPGQICISLNEEVVHGIGGQRRIAYGDLVKMDVGVIVDGWIGDTATTVCCGAAEPEAERLCEVTRRILESVIPLATAGRRLGDLGHHVESEATRAGFSVVREFVGHGVGSKLHEEPQIPNYGQPGTGPKLRPGMTLAIEPMINLGVAGVRILEDGWTVVTQDGKPSSHFEHTVLVTENEPEVLTCPTGIV